MSDEDYTPLHLMRDIHQTQRIFFGLIRFLDGPSRARSMNNFLQNTAVELSLLRQYMRTQQATTRMVFNLPLNLDVSGNFLDPVVVRPTQQQIEEGTERNVSVIDMTCSICQESVTSATRIRQCGHCFHEACITQWFSMNPRCPMCRADVREVGGAGSEHRHRADTFDSLLRALNNHTRNEDSRLHPDTE